MSTTMKWGLITGIIYVVFSLLGNLLGIQDEGGFALKALAMNTVLMVVTFFTIYTGVKEFRDQQNNGFLTFGEGFRKGMGIALIASVLVLLFTFLYLFVIDPGFIDKAAEMAEEQWEKQGLTEEQRDVARGTMGMFMSPWFFSLIALVSCLIWGLIKSLVAAAILKNEPPPTFMQSPEVPNS